MHGFSTPPPEKHIFPMKKPKTAPPSNPVLLPPEHLAPKAKALWAEVVPDRICDAECLALLSEALSALDRATAAREQIDREGMVAVSSTGVPHANPLLRVEKDARQQFARIWTELGLSQPATTIGSAMELLERLK